MNCSVKHPLLSSVQNIFEAYNSRADCLNKYNTGIVYLQTDIEIMGNQLS